MDLRKSNEVDLPPLKVYLHTVASFLSSFLATKLDRKVFPDPGLPVIHSRFDL